MPTRTALAVLALLSTLAGCATTPAGGGSEARWTLVGRWTDSCCCKVPCPCFFGSKPTEGYCEGASLLEVERGRFGDVRLDGLSAIVAYRVGGWSKAYVQEGAEPAQVSALAQLLPEALPFLAKGTPPVAVAAPLQVSRGAGTITYSAPEAAVELTIVESKSGEPIRLTNLPAKGTPFPEFHDHVQYRSARMAYSGAEGPFEYAGRNGFDSSVDVAGSADACGCGSAGGCGSGCGSGGGCSSAP